MSLPASSSGVFPGSKTNSDALTQPSAPSICWGGGCAGKHKAPSLTTPLSPRRPHKASHALVCESLESMTNVHWKFRSVPPDHICICLLWYARTADCADWTRERYHAGRAAQMQISGVEAGRAAFICGQRRRRVRARCLQQLQKDFAACETLPECFRLRKQKESCPHC